MDEGTRLEIAYPPARWIVGSNPTLSATSRAAAADAVQPKRARGCQRGAVTIGHHSSLHERCV